MIDHPKTVNLREGDLLPHLDKWITSLCANAKPDGHPGDGRLNQLVVQLRPVVEQLATATPRDRSSLYEQLGIEVVYRPGERLVVATADPAGWATGQRSADQDEPASVTATLRL